MINTTEWLNRVQVRSVLHINLKEFSGGLDGVRQKGGTRERREKWDGRKRSGCAIGKAVCGASSFLGLWESGLEYLHVGAVY